MTDRAGRLTGRTALSLSLLPAGSVWVTDEDEGGPVERVLVRPLPSRQLHWLGLAARQGHEVDAQVGGLLAGLVAREAAQPFTGLFQGGSSAQGSLQPVALAQ